MQKPVAHVRSLLALKACSVVFDWHMCFYVFYKTLSQSLWDLTMLLEVGKGGVPSASWGNDGSEWFSNLPKVKWLVQWHICYKSSGKTRTASYLIFVFPVHAAQCQAHCGAWWMTLSSHIGWFAQDCEDKVITVWLAVWIIICTSHIFLSWAVFSFHIHKGFALNCSPLGLSWLDQARLLTLGQPIHQWLTLVTLWFGYKDPLCYYISLGKC